MATIQGRNGVVVKVDSDGRMETLSVAQHEDKHAADEGRVWSVFFTVTPTGANHYFFYVKNNGLKDIHLTDIRISSTVATQIFYRYVTGTASAGTDSEITNRFLGNSAVPDAIVQHDADFTGLTSAGVLFFQECDTVDRLFHMKTTSNIIIPQGQAIAFQRVEATGLLNCMVSLIEVEL